jgi:hypothetical protein
MDVSMLIRRRLPLLAVVAAAAACSDGPIAPPVAERPAFDMEALQPLATKGGEKNSSSAYSKDGNEKVATLTIDPNSARTYTFGEHWIYFPARSICDPATSGYGETLWDAPCTPVTTPIKVTVHWSTKGGHAFARFTPELRFVPAAADNSSRWIILSLHDQRPVRHTDVYCILYNGAESDGWVDESLADPTLRAWKDLAHNSIVRRIKHFSGYMVSAAYFDLGGIDASY